MKILKGYNCTEPTCKMTFFTSVGADMHAHSNPGHIVEGVVDVARTIH